MKTRIVIILTGILLSVWASNLGADDLSQFRTAIFAKVINISKDDVLNIRNKPDYKSDKIGEAHSSAILGVNICKKNKESIWCKVSTLTDLEYIKTGWVNAKYLDAKWEYADRGYVKITGRSNLCYYAIKCEEKSGVLKCMVGNSDFSEFIVNNSFKPTIEWVDRDALHAGTAFDSAPENSDGYCSNGKMIDDYFK